VGIRTGTIPTINQANENYMATNKTIRGKGKPFIKGKMDNAMGRGCVCDWVGLVQ